MTTRQAERAYTITEAAELKSVSPSVIRKAIAATEGNVLRAKNISDAKHPRYRISASALEDWWEGLSEA